MVNKKGQLTIFIIIGIVLLAIAGVAYYYMTQIKKTEVSSETSELSSDILPVKAYIDSCIKSVGKDAIFWIGQQGGYYIPPEKSIVNYYLKIPYYYYLGDSVMPTMDRVERELAAYVNNMLPNCTNNLEEIESLGFNVEQGTVSTKARISPNMVTFDVNLPVVIKETNKKSSVSDFKVVIGDIRLYTIYDVARNLTIGQLNDPTSICLSCVANIGTDTGLNIEMERWDTSTVLFIITDNQSKLDSTPYTYKYAYNYTVFSCTNRPPNADIEFTIDCTQKKLNSAGYVFAIHDIPDSSANVNVSFSYNVTAEGYNVSFSTYTSLFSIDEKTGFIEFVPTEEDIGDHHIWVEAKDGYGNTKYSEFMLQIVGG
jgi:hypothetical protein